MSQSSISTLALTLKATTAIAAGRFVTPTGGQCVADTNAIGAARTAAAVGEAMTVDVRGTATVEAGAVVAAGATVKSDASGRAIPWVTSGARLGIALEWASAAGQFIEVLLVDNAA